MKAKFCFVLSISFLVLFMFSSGCSQKAATTQPAPVSRLEPVPSPAPTAQPMPPQPKPVVQKPMAGSVFFASNKSDITPQAAVALRNQAEWLKQNPEMKMQISGNADQRAGEEYNQALGQKRADAVKDYLVQLGVGADRLETTSYGKDRPICTESKENCYSANRRVDLQAIG